MAGEAFSIHHDVFMPGCFKNKINDGKAGGDGTLMWNQRRNLRTITVLFVHFRRMV
ncbi:MAG: hypothetical protein NTW95_00530 [Candidatus Aminicenantes bacterium]|nr:hypothetical protein [Candidatus Aminicenantes bacterium]